MEIFRLDNYVRTHRKRAALSQDEVAFLMGVQSGSKISRYERGSREPGLNVAIAYEVIFGAAIRDLYAGRFNRLERDIARRARLLAERLREKNGSRTVARKLTLLSEIAAREMTRES